MTTKEKQGFGLYFLLAFGLAWLCQVGGCMVLLQKQNAVLYQLALVATMLCPLLAVLLVTEARHRLRSKAIPEAFRGLPITLVYIGVLALAIYGFTGHSVIL